jgi:hypothetical protein
MKRAPTTTIVSLNQPRRPTVGDVIDRVLDKGIVIEYQISRMSLSGIDLPVTVDGRFVVASLDTYLEYAEPLSRSGVLAGSDAWLHELGAP